MQLCSCLNRMGTRKALLHTTTHTLSQILVLQKCAQHLGMESNFNTFITSHYYNSICDWPKDVTKHCVSFMRLHFSDHISARRSLSINSYRYRNSFITFRTTLNVKTVDGLSTSRLPILNLHSIYYKNVYPLKFIFPLGKYHLLWVNKSLHFPTTRAIKVQSNKLFSGLLILFF